MTKKILVPVDLSGHSESLIHYGYGLAWRLGATVDFLHVMPQPSAWRGYEPWVPPVIDEGLEDIVRQKIHHWAQKAEEHLGIFPGGEYGVLAEEGNPTERIVHLAKERDYSLIIIARQGHSALERFFVGSVAAGVARSAPCSVLIYTRELEEIL